MVVTIRLPDKDSKSSQRGDYSRHRHRGDCGCRSDKWIVCIFCLCCIPVSICWFFYKLADLCCGDCYRAIKKRKQDTSKKKEGSIIKTT